MILEKLNIELVEEDYEYSEGIVYCSSNLEEVRECPFFLIIEALGDAGYFYENHDYTAYEVVLLQKTINEFSTDCVKVGVITNKHFWFDEK